MKKPLIFLGSFLAIPIVVLAIIGAFSTCNFIRNASVDPDSPAGMAKCEEAYRQMMPLIAAAEMYIKMTGAPARNDSDLLAGSTYVEGSSVFFPIYYWGEDNGGYTILKKIGWDASVIFARQSTGERRFYLDPGDGSERVSLEALMQNGTR